jgi:predicted AlkP superfamily pyrophosphatase or phosphodiesterase
MKLSRFRETLARVCSLRAALATVSLAMATAIPALAAPPPRIIVISLDGATPRIVKDLLKSGALPDNSGIGLLKKKGFWADQNITITPSLTAAAHIAIATGSTAPKNDIPSNTFALVASPFLFTDSGFAAPIGGYSIDGPGISQDLTANPVWRALREKGKIVVTATFPGGDGLDVKVPGLANSPIVQPASVRTVDYTVPFGEFGGVGGQGFTLTASNFSTASDSTVSQLEAAGKSSYSTILQTAAPLETFTVGGVSYTIEVAALDTTNDSVVNYDTLVFFDTTNGIKPGPFTLPSTGPAYVKASDKSSSPFYLEGSPKKGGCAYYLTVLAPDLSTVHIARYSVDDIPPNPAVQSSVDDINNNVGFWADQADFRFPERINPGLTNFSDQELEDIFEDQVSHFVDYQTRLALRAIQQNPDADLVMVYIEQPDGSEHQFLLTDLRQATNPRDPSSIYQQQDPAKIARYQKYITNAYQTANSAVERIIDAVGTDSKDKPLSDVFVVSDHGFDPFFTSVSMTNLLASAGIDSSKVRAVTSGPAVHVYINLQGREPNGTVPPSEYITLQRQVANLLQNFKDTNPLYTLGRKKVNVFDKVYTRPVSIGDANFGRETNANIGQDSGDVFAMLTDGYNFDGTQSPVVQRQGDASSTALVLSVSNFYGAHGYDPNIKDMSALFVAAGPDIGKGNLDLVHNIDLAPTFDAILKVKPDSTVEGKPLKEILQ